MLTFKEYIYEQLLILEDRLDKIKEIFKDKIDPFIVDHFATHADPTHNKAHTQWIVSLYHQGQFSQEDHLYLARIREALSAFNRPAVKAGLKANKKPTDINQYKSLSDLEDAIEPHKEAISGKEVERKIKSEGADLIHSGNGVTIHHIKTKEAACSYGAGTKWCTRNTSGENNNKFDFYNKRGPIFIIQHKGRKYQFHNASSEFMDEKNRPIMIKDLHPDIQKEMIKSDHPEVQKANILKNNPHVTSEHITEALKNFDGYVAEMALRHHPDKIQQHHIDMAMQHHDGIAAETALRRHRDKIQQHHIDMAMQHNDSDVAQTALRHHPDKIQQHHIDMVMQHHDGIAAETALYHYADKIQQHHIDAFLKRTDVSDKIKNRVLKQFQTITKRNARKSRL